MQEITLRLSLQHTDITGLEKMTYAVSDPANSLYGQHLTSNEVAAYVKPTDATLSSVMEWLSSHSVTAKSISPASDMLEITVPVGTANSLLAAEFSEFRHIVSGWKSVRTLSYSVLAALQGSIQFIHPTVSFVPLLSRSSVTAINHRRDFRLDNLQKQRSVADVPASCGEAITPSCLQAMLKVAILLDKTENYINVANELHMCRMCDVKFNVILF
ncbi:Pro-kumamolisin, activation domain-containing protein [Mycena olivaceomarginata]|nr:Pro-kumamolisin, activation domain-containing protein [Mycena olivaceomarginata]